MILIQAADASRASVSLPASRASVMVSCRLSSSWRPPMAILPKASAEPRRA